MSPSLPPLGRFSFELKIGPISCCGQLFFLHRLYQISKNKIISACVLVLIIFTFTSSMYTESFVWAGNVRAPNLQTWLEVAAWSGVATDTLLCSAFMWYMWEAGAENRGFRKSTDLVRFSLYLLYSTLCESADSDHFSAGDSTYFDHHFIGKFILDFCQLTPSSSSFIF